MMKHDCSQNLLTDRNCANILPINSSQNVTVLTNPTMEQYYKVRPFSSVHLHIFDINNLGDGVTESMEVEAIPRILTVSVIPEDHFCCYGASENSSVSF